MRVTLVPRLAEIDRSFVAVVDDFRRDEALRLIETTRVPFVEVAHRVGFAEQSSFNRAFRRWTGRTPREARTAALPREGKR